MLIGSDTANFLLFSGTSHPKLTQEIAESLGVQVGRIKVQHFPDNEISLRVLEDVRGRDVFVLQTIALDPNNYLMELLILVDALKRASAKSICAVIPYFGYSRQDRADRPGDPITARLIANLLESAGVTSVCTVDLHAEQIQGFFDVPVDHLHSWPLFIEALREVDTANMVVVAPDAGSVKLARNIASCLSLDFALLDKERLSAQEVQVVAMIGDIEGKDVLLADDMSSTAGTLVSAAKACQEKGAKRIFCVVTHGLFVGDSVEKIERSPIEKLLVCNTIPWTCRLDGSTKITSISVAPLLSNAIKRVLA